jgi:hypothetical protein
LDWKTIIAAYVPIDAGHVHLEFAGETLDRELRNPRAKLSDPRR